MRARRTTKLAVTAIWAVLLTTGLSACDPREWFVCAIGACGETLDTRPPFPPQNPRAVAFSRGVALDWTASYSSDVAEYRIYRSTVSGGGRTQVATTPTTSFRDTGLDNGTQYFYVIGAADSLDRESVLSVEVAATPQAGAAPAPPAGLTATENEGFVDLMWAASFTAVKYHVWRATTSGGQYTEIGTATGTSYRDSSGQSGTRYYYAVNAENAEGAAGALSNEVAATPGGVAGFGYVGAWGGLGEGPGEFEGLVDVAIDRFGNVYTLEDFPNWRVQRFTASGTFVREWQTIGDMNGIATDFAGNVYVTNALFNRVQKYSPEGADLGTFGGSGSESGKFDDIYDLAIDAELGVLVTDKGNDRVQRFSTAGTYLGQFGGGPGTGNGQFEAPTGITIDRQFGVYVVDSGNHRIQKLNGATGQFIAKWGAAGTANGEFQQPVSVAASGTGVWVTDAQANRVQAFSLAGAWVTWFGGAGGEPGRFSGPQGIAADCASNVYVADRGNHRIQRFAPATATPCNLGFAGAFASRSFQGSFVATKSAQGKLALAAGRYSEKGARQQGTFKLPGAGRLARGRWYALFDVSADPVTRNARASGRLLAVGKGRSACLSFALTVSNGDVRGSFSGGARGSFRQRLGSSKAWSVRGSGSPGRSSTTACKAVKKAYKLR